MSVLSAALTSSVFQGKVVDYRGHNISMSEDGHLLIDGKKAHHCDYGGFDVAYGVGASDYCVAVLRGTTVYIFAGPATGSSRISEEMALASC